MMKLRIPSRLSVAIAILLFCAIVTHLAPVYASEVPASPCKADAPLCFAPNLFEQTQLFDTATVPKIATPDWMIPPPVPISSTVTYSVQSRGHITSDLEEFASLANQTLNDGRGWSRLGVRFERVASGGQFTLYLTEASQMTTFSATGCDTVYSCTVGNAVIINQDRWINTTPMWQSTGGSLRDYRHMVVNHETGHWLGHGHEYCAGAGQAAPVMQQQSIDLQGCQPNPWPLSSEMYAPKLGIRS